MKIAVTAQNSGWTELLDTRFGRATCFVIVNGETKEWQAVENEQNRQATQGAGIQAARTIIDQGAEVLISGNVGPKAFRVLHAASVHMFRTDPTAQKTVSEAVAAWERGELAEIQAATVEGHSV
ncbi:MAG: NifB/NifX family molybdenum-iron cluster-binding protein [Syntrophales bacterium]|jgi:predicted Fe-Mo cluster-binding NifX family protein|nr:NifB/NifX family molybdenum-iron cluster-binding protein [Syntrophales bacterium]